VSRLVKAVIALSIVAFLVAMGGFVLAAISLHDLHTSEQKTCRIQARGLPASKHLARVMVDFNTLLAPMPGEDLSKLRPLLRLAIADLRRELPAYNRIEARQPANRSC
jgi:hypothetical protein